jgi:hypothetical protein
MSTEEEIEHFIAGLSEPKQKEIKALHALTLRALPGCKLWFFDGKNSDGKTVANPTIGYGSHIIEYSNGKTRESFRIGLSANKTGISVYILGIKDKKHLAHMYAGTIGKASVSGYCIKFRSIQDINTGILETAIKYGPERNL